MRIVFYQYFHLNKTQQILLKKPNIPIQLKLIKFLLNNKTNINKTNHLNNTPLTTTTLSKFKNPSLITYLLKKNTNPNTKNTLNFTTLHLTTQKNYLKSIKILIKNKTQLKTNNTKKITPLQLTYYKYHNNIIK